MSLKTLVQDLFDLDRPFSINAVKERWGMAGIALIVANAFLLAALIALGLFFANRDAEGAFYTFKCITASLLLFFLALATEIMLLWLDDGKEYLEDYL